MRPLMCAGRYLFLLLDEGEASAPFRNLSNFVYRPLKTLTTLRFPLPLIPVFRFNTEAHLLPLAAPPPAKFIPLLSRSTQSPAADATLSAGFGEHGEESSAAAAVIAGAAAALLVGFYLCFRWRAGRCYRKEGKLRKD